MQIQKRNQKRGRWEGAHCFFYKIEFVVLINRRVHDLPADSRVCSTTLHFRNVGSHTLNIHVLSAGRIQVTTPVDREEKERQNQRMYWTAEGFVTRTSEALGKTTVL